MRRRSRSREDIPEDAEAAPHARDDEAAGRGERPSKSALKRELHALQELGARLIPLADEKLLALPVPPKLVDAVRLAREIRSREGLRRQVQYIGRLMRDVDADALRAALEGDQRAHRAETALMHAAERWRERMLASPEGLDQWLARHPDTEASVRALLEGARRELAGGAAGRRFRELYRTLRAALEAEASGAAPSPN